MSFRLGRVRMWRGGLRFSLLLPPLSFDGASIAQPSLRFHILLIKPDRQISRIRLSDKTSRLRTRKVRCSSLDPRHRTVYPGVQQPSVLHITVNATTWAFIRFPNYHSGSFFASTCGTFRSSRTSSELPRVAPISCASPLPAPVLNSGPFPPPALPGFFSHTGLSATL